MNEFEKHLPEKKTKETIEVVVPEKKLQHLGTFKFCKGHKLFKMELATSLITEVNMDFESSTYKLDSIDLKKRKRVRGENFIRLLNNAAKENNNNYKMKLVQEKGFIYCTALNKKNAFKRFVKMLSSK